MKTKILVLLGLTSLLAIPAPVHAQLIQYDGFAYATNSTLAGNGTWTNLNTGTAPVIASSNLPVSGLAAPTGERVTWVAGNIQEAWNQLGVTNTNGTLYYSLAFQLTSVPTTATYSFAFTQNNTTYGTSVWLQASGTNNFNVGLAPRTATPSYLTNVFDLNTTIFLVGSYQFVDGSANDVVSLWINPSSSSFEAGSAPTADLTLTNAGTDLTSVSGFLLRGATGSPAGTMDELRVGSTWASVTPVPEPSTYALLALAAAGVAGYVVRRRRR